ncbi:MULTISPECIES: hypothetical protein [Bacillus]|uniref:hypothetical protein n=1 Tax=Bacillus TaxID=1386 RepID=UPI000C76F9D3|nr:MULTISPECIES: hypothetical protein [Bacillus]MCP1159344.1 hypothetical protein [Bacillus infantis]PLR72231.1 hypothetical protein CYJ37_11795 [Bacillus sp. UMB0728]
MNIVDKSSILRQMTNRMDSLQHMIDRDFGGNTHDILIQYRELKYWKEAIERNEFKIRLLGDDE